MLHNLNSNLRWFISMFKIHKNFEKSAQVPLNVYQISVAWLMLWWSESSTLYGRSEFVHNWEACSRLMHFRYAHHAECQLCFIIYRPFAIQYQYDVICFTTVPHRCRFRRCVTTLEEWIFGKKEIFTCGRRFQFGVPYLLQTDWKSL